MGKRWVIAALVAWSVSAWADTGGSMGGGDWSSSSSSSGGSYSSSSGGGYSSSSDDYSFSGGSSSGTGDLGAGALVVFGVGVVLVLVFAVLNELRDSGPSMTFEVDSYTPVYDGVDLSVLRIALDGRARKFVQSELARIAGIADTKTRDGRATMLREVCLLLRRLKDAWVYGGAINEPMRALSAAKPVFDQRVDDERARFREETVRNEQGTTTRTAASAYTPRSDEGAGVILVSIIIASRTELVTVTRIGDGENLRQALDAVGHLSPEQLVAVEVVWQPSEDADRLSSIELEAKYPRPELIPIQNALVGKTFCAYCGGPFPAELVTCPHCGAPAPGREAAKAA